VALLGAYLGSLLGGGGGFSVELVEQVALNAVRVTFDVEVIRFNRNATGDALNTAHYLLNNGVLTQWVTADEGNAVLVFFDQPLVPGIEVELAIEDVESVSGLTLAYTTATFVPFGVDLPAEPPTSLPGRWDIANPQTVRDANGGPLGTFPVTEAGDLGNDTGRTNLRKRVFRRITTRPGGFFHLPNYGALRHRDKTLLTPTSLRELQLDLESQVRAEPDVVAVRVRVRELQPGIVRVTARVQDALGAFEIDGQLDLNGGPDA